MKSAALACACPVAGYIDLVILWHVQFSFVLGSVSHFLRFSSAFSFSTIGSPPFSWTPQSFFVCVLFKHASQYDEQRLGFVGPAQSCSVHEWWIRALDYISFHFFILFFFVTLFGRHLSGDSVTGHLPSFSAVAPSDVGSFLGEQSVKFFQQYVWQFQRGLFRDTPTSTSTGCRLSFLAGSVTVPSFLCSYSSVGIPMVPRASQPPAPAVLAPSLFDSSLVPSTSSPTLAPLVGKAFIVGPV